METALGTQRVNKQRESSFVSGMSARGEEEESSEISSHTSDDDTTTEDSEDISDREDVSFLFWLLEIVFCLRYDVIIVQLLDCLSRCWCMNFAERAFAKTRRKIGKWPLCQFASIATRISFLAFDYDTYIHLQAKTQEDGKTNDEESDEFAFEESVGG